MKIVTRSESLSIARLQEAIDGIVFSRKYVLTAALFSAIDEVFLQTDETRRPMR